MAENLLELEQISVDYGAAHALIDVSLNVSEASIVSLLGGNASGKSTTMKTILGIVKPVSGKIRFQNSEINSWPTAKRIAAGIASVPEARRVFGPMSVEDNLLIGAFTRTSRKQIQDDLQEQYERFPRLAERRHQAAGTLSGGEQQLLAFARALMSHPKLICMDEPTMGLAPKLVDEVLATISQLNKELGIAVLMVEQQAQLALSIADYGYVLSSGELSVAGQASQLLDDARVQEAYLGQNKTKEIQTS